MTTLPASHADAAEIGREDPTAVKPSPERLRDAKPDVRARIERMAARFGLWPEQIDRDPAVAREVVEACAGCHCAGQCQERFASDESAEIQRQCPNAMLYRSLRSQF